MEFMLFLGMIFAAFMALKHFLRAVEDKIFGDENDDDIHF